MEKLANKLLKYMADKHSQTSVISFHFSELKTYCSDATKNDVVDALNYLEHHGYIRARSYSNKPLIIYLLPAAYCSDDVDDGNRDTKAASKTRKKKISINWNAVGVIIAGLTLLFYILDKFL